MCRFRASTRSQLPAVLQGQRRSFGLLGFLSGGALQKLSVIAMGITPYINASIIMQLMTVVLPQLEELAKKGGEEGRKKISQYTRWLTIVLAHPGDVHGDLDGALGRLLR